MPRARGGLTTVDKVRLLCRAHNQQSARKTYGAEYVEERVRRARSARRPATLAEPVLKPVVAGDAAGHLASLACAPKRLTRWPATAAHLVLTPGIFNARARAPKWGGYVERDLHCDLAAEVRRGESPRWGER